jgi:type II secretory pathway pseudopilin PulG
MRRRNTLFQQTGFGLVDILIAMAVSSIGLFAFSSAVLNAQTSGNFIGSLKAQSDLTFAIRRAIHDRRALKITGSNSLPMKAVVNGDWTLMTVLSGNPYEIDLYDANGNIIAGKASTGPVYYTLDGYPCTIPLTGKCFIAATAVFQIQGEPRMGSVGNAIPTDKYSSWDPRLRPDYIELDYKIEVLPGAPGPSRKPVTGAIFFAYRDIGFTL